MEKESVVVVGALCVPPQACKKGFLRHREHSCLKTGQSEILQLCSEVHLQRVSLCQCINSSLMGFMGHISAEESLKWCCLGQDGDDLPRSLSPWAVPQPHRACIPTKKSTRCHWEMPHRKGCPTAMGPSCTSTLCAEDKPLEVAEGAAKNLPASEGLCRIRPLVFKISFDVT